MNKSFTGPLFIVGLSRSGTKLIRDLLNKNANISLPEIESHFIPEMLSNPDLTIDELHRKIANSSFVKRFPSIDWPSLEKLEELQHISSTPSFIEAILKYYALDKREGKWKTSIIWGDKTPSYLRNLDLLKAHYPECKFVHIIRDPRDRALSVKKTWGKSMYRATELWTREIMNSIEWRSQVNSYMEIKYEELITNTEVVLKSVCEFLEVEFSSNMLELNRPSEKYGNHKSQKRLGTTSMMKYNSEDPKKIKRIEEIAYPMMKQLCYNIRYAKKHKPFSTVKMFIFKFTDFIKFKLNVKLKGY